MTVFTARSGVLALILGTMLLAGLHTAAALAQEPLLSYQPIRTAMMPLDTEPTTVAEYEVSFNTWALARSERHHAEFVLPDGSRFKAVPEEIKFRGDWTTDFAWRGWLEGEGGRGRAVITVHRGHISARITLPGRDVIALKPGPEPGVARLLELDSSKFPGCGTDDHEFKAADTGGSAASFPPVAPASAGSAPIIDVMVVYTPLARQTAGGADHDPIRAIIQGAVDEANDAYANSEVFQRLNLVHTQEVDYHGDHSGPTGDSADEQRDWLLVEVNLRDLKPVRDQHRADMVTMISEYIPGVCGKGFIMSFPGPQFASSAISVSRRTCVTGNLTFAHELGHNMGADHDEDNATGGAHDWSFGHFIDLPGGGKRRTVMAQPGPCGSCQRVEYFSNPNVFYRENETDPGVATGIANQSDNARTLNLTANIVANFRAGNWLYADRFEERGYALSGTTVPPPMTQAEACAELKTQLSQFEARLAEKGATLDRADEDAMREYEEETGAVDDIRKHLANECQ